MLRSCGVLLFPFLSVVGVVAIARALSRGMARLSRGVRRSQRRGRPWLQFRIVLCVFKLRQRVRKAALVSGTKTSLVFHMVRVRLIGFQVIVFLSGDGRRRARDYMLASAGWISVPTEL